MGVCDSVRGYCYFFGAYSDIIYDELFMIINNAVAKTYLYHCTNYNINIIICIHDYL